MIHTELIKNRFDSLEAYEKFAAEWAEACCIVNKNSRNKAEKPQVIALCSECYEEFVDFLER